jgi:hypothetical protein
MPTTSVTPQGVIPPLRVSSSVRLAWSLTLNLSGDSNQNEMGQTIKEQWVALIKRYTAANESIVTENKTRNASISRMSTGNGAQPNNRVVLTESTMTAFPSEQSFNSFIEPRDLLYIENLWTVIGSYLRRTGFERDVYARYLDTLDKNRLEYIESLNELADMTSFSSESLIVRISSFLALGAAADIINDIFSVIAIPGPGGTPIPWPDPVVFLAFGGIGLFLTLVVFKIWRKWKFKERNNDMFQEQGKYWNDIARPNFKKGLIQLYNDVRELAVIFYPGYSEPPFNNPNLLDNFIDTFLPSKNVYNIPKGRKHGWS